MQIRVKRSYNYKQLNYPCQCKRPTKCFWASQLLNLPPLPKQSPFFTLASSSALQPSVHRLAKRCQTGINSRIRSSTKRCVPTQWRHAVLRDTSQAFKSLWRTMPTVQTLITSSSLLLWAPWMALATPWRFLASLTRSKHQNLPKIWASNTRSTGNWMRSMVKSTVYTQSSGTLPTWTHWSVCTVASLQTELKNWASSHWTPHVSPTS